MASEIVHHHDVAVLQRRHKDLLHVEQEALTIDGAIKQAGRGDAITAKCGKEGQCFPMPMRHMSHQSLALGAPSPQGCHVGLGPRLINEHKTIDINPPLVLAPAIPPPRHIGPVLLIPINRFF